MLDEPLDGYDPQLPRALDRRAPANVASRQQHGGEEKGRESPPTLPP